MSANLFTNYSQASLGQDVEISDEADGGDLVATSGGDIAFVVGDTNLQAAIVRRVVTPQGNLARYVQDTTGLVSINQDYGNLGYKYLSEPLNALTISRIKDQIRSCLSQDPRIVVGDINPSVVPYGGTFQVVYNISYTVVGSSVMQSLAVVQSNATFTGA